MSASRRAKVLCLTRGVVEELRLLRCQRQRRLRVVQLVHCLSLLPLRIIFNLRHKSEPRGRAPVLHNYAEAPAVRGAQGVGQHHRNQRCRRRRREYGRQACGRRSQQGVRRSSTQSV